MTANACDVCQRELGEDDGALCVWCVQALVQERSDEWWSEVPC